MNSKHTLHKTGLALIIGTFVATGSTMAAGMNHKQAIITPNWNNGRVYIYTGSAPGKPEGIAHPSLYMSAQIIDPSHPETALNALDGRCLKYTAHLDRSPNWCGVAWSTAPRGDAPGAFGETNIYPAFNLRGASKLIVHLRGQKGGERVMVKIGILGDKPYGDSLPAGVPIESPWYELSTQWKQFTINIPQNADLSHIYTPLCWVADQVHQPSDMNTLTFYIDDCYFEKQN